ncbi:MAG: hypothetical protein HZA54_07285, partial [Planctomycetes bacterium]|nr:hypothetical protein [Planctomycetota bacterium]
MVGRFGAGAGRRRRARVGRLAGFLLCATAWCGGPCAADVVRLKNGTLLEGRIVAEDDRALVLEIMGGRMQIPRADVLSVTREALRPEPRKAAP